MKRHISRGLVLAVLAAASPHVHDIIASPPQTGSSRHVAEFLRLARSELARSNTCEKAKEYLQALPLKQRLAVARASANDPDANIGYLCANFLIAHGYAGDAVRALAAILASGRDQTQLNGRFGYDWLHDNDDSLFLLMMIRINRYLLADLSKYTGEQRKRVEGVLMGGLFAKPSEPFSQEKAKKLISEWESELRRRR